VIRRLRKECGQALPMALAIMTIFGILTAAITINGAANDRSSLKSADARQAFALAQSALAYGEGAVYSASGTAPPSTLQTIPTQAGGGTGTYKITQVSGSCNCTWSVTATGSVDGVSRTITAIATGASTTTVNDYSVWNYLYSDSTSVCTTVAGGVTVSVPILTRGSVCITGGGHFLGSQLKVGGTLTDTGGSNIGTSSAKVSTVEIGGCTAWNTGDNSTSGTCKTTTATSCTVQPSTVQTVAPGVNPCDGAHSPLYATSVGNTLDVTPQMPCIGQPNSYDPTCTTANGNNGNWTKLTTVYTAQKNATKTGCPTNLLDNDTTLNNSDSSISSVMFGSTAYDCKIGTIGEIKYTPSGGSCGTGTLVVSGTIYFDGSLSMGCGLKVVYSGQATLYFTGTVTQQGGTQLCGIASCTASWNPSTNGIIFIAGCWTNSTGSTLASSKCVYITGGSTAQWGAYATTAYQIDGGSSNMGPVLANSMSIGGGSSTLIPFTVMPPGTPLNTDSHYVAALPPSSWSG
jgi:Tfp pilus assembly protein PilX